MLILFMLRHIEYLGASTVELMQSLILREPPIAFENNKVLDGVTIAKNNSIQFQTIV